MSVTATPAFMEVTARTWSVIIFAIACMALLVATVRSSWMSASQNHVRTLVIALMEWMIIYVNALKAFMAAIVNCESIFAHIHLATMGLLASVLLLTTIVSALRVTQEGTVKLN